MSPSFDWILASRVHRPGTPGFDAACSGFDLSAIPTPDLVVSAAGEDDVADAVRLAPDHGFPVAVRATGHGPGARRRPRPAHRHPRDVDGHDRSRVPHRHGRRRRDMDIRAGGVRAARARTAVRVRTERRRRGLHDGRRPRRARAAVRLRRRPCPPDPPGHCDRRTARGHGGHRSRPVLGRPGRRRQLRHRHRAGDRPRPRRQPVRRRAVLPRRGRGRPPRRFRHVHGRRTRRAEPVDRLHHLS